MIKTKAFETSDKQVFTDINLARQHELAIFLKANIQQPFALNETDAVSADKFYGDLSAQLDKHADKIVDLLTLKATSRPAARKTNKKKGASKSTETASATPATTAGEPATK